MLRLEPHHHNNLPHDVSSFVGRERERAEAIGLLSKSRLVTLVGPGGVGKTRLALRVARDLLADFTGGVWLAELGPLNGPDLVPSVIGLAVGVRQQPGQAMVDTLANVFGNDSVLIVLDNCEHLVGACAALAERLLRTCPALSVLATSREPLGVPGEIIWPMPSLSLPPAARRPPALDEVVACDAVKLFVERATAAQPRFVLNEGNAELIVRICRRLDGLPLAIELAAARLRVLSPVEIAERLENRFALLTGGARTAPARQQTLRATVNWSIDMLSEPDCRLFARLSVFPASFSIQAVEAVCADEPGAVLDALSSLVNRSLVITESGRDGETRYRLLETLRALAAEHLAASGQAEQVHQRHAEWFADQAARAELEFYGPHQGHWLRWVEREHDDLRKAVDWAIEGGDATSALRTASACSWSWGLHMRWSESRALLQRVLSMSGALRPTALRGRALLGLGEVSAFLGDLDAAQACFEETTAIGLEIADERLAMEGRGARQLVFQFLGDFTSLEAEAVHILEFARRTGYTWAEIRELETLAHVAASRGNRDQAAAYLTDGERLARSTGDIWSLARVLEALGDVRRSAGEHPRAGSLYRESQSLFAELGLGPYPGVIHNLGYVALAAAEPWAAAEHFGEAMDLFRRVGDWRGAAECVIGFGCVLSASGLTGEAVRLFSAGQAALAALGTQLWPSNRRDYERWLANARNRLADSTFADAWAAGRKLTLESAIAACAAGHVTSPHRAATPVSPLTAREREVASLVAKGLSNRQVAKALVVTEKTAANHLQRVLDKLDLHSRAQLAARATELGLIGPGPTDTRVEL